MKDLVGNANATVVAIKNHPFSGANDERKETPKRRNDNFLSQCCLPCRLGRKQDTYIIPRVAKENIILGNKFDEQLGNNAFNAAYPYAWHTFVVCATPL
jgi:hypothetical protein